MSARGWGGVSTRTLGRYPLYPDYLNMHIKWKIEPIREELLNLILQWEEPLDPPKMLLKAYSQTEKTAEAGAFKRVCSWLLQELSREILVRLFVPLISSFSCSCSSPSSFSSCWCSPPPCSYFCSVLILVLLLALVFLVHVLFSLSFSLWWQNTQLCNTCKCACDGANSTLLTLMAVPCPTGR